LSFHAGEATVDYFARALPNAMKPELADREPIAYHEVGHLTAHQFYGHKVLRVEVGDGHGCTVLAKPQTFYGFDLIVALCSGKAAVDKWYGWKSENQENWLKSEDQRRAFRIALYLSENDAFAAALLVQWAEKVADRIISNHWDKMHDPAMRLIERGRLEVG
jgi:hypothetical protein